MFQIIIVDDHPDQVESIARHLPLDELHIDVVHKAYSGKEALEIIQNEPVNIVVTDIKMPGMDGIELVQEVSKLRRPIRCILLTGYAEFDYARKALNNHVSDYLLKPADIEELADCIRRAVEGLEQQMREVLSYQRASYTLRENLPLLRDVLLKELLQGRRYSSEALAQRLERLELPVAQGSPVALMAVRLEETVKEAEDISLLEFAVSNMAEEIFGDEFLLWRAKDEHHYLVYAVLRRDGDAEPGNAHMAAVEHHASMLQQSVMHYLKRTISVVTVKRWGIFPSSLAELHETAVAAFRQHIGDSTNLFHSASDRPSEVVQSMFESLYQPPLLIHMLETAQWDSVMERLSDIFAELEQKRAVSPEYIQEAYCALSGAFYYYAHKNGQQLQSAIGKLSGGMPEGVTAEQSARHLQQWAEGIVRVFRDQSTNETRSSRQLMVQKINRYIEEHLDSDISLQSLSDHLHLHPAYISKIYKMETGVSIGEYLTGYRMKAASGMLRDSADKIYEIGARLGYITTHYFIKVFKKHYGMTPQEYRDRVQQ